MSPRDQGSAEDRLIERIFKPLATSSGALGLTDDAATLRPPPGCDLVLTTDAIVEGVHFLPDDAPDSVARKALRVNLSDLAAKGAKPVGFLLSLGLSEKADEAWLLSFATGMRADIGEFHCALFGGDTVRSPAIVINVTMFGFVPEGEMVRRAGAKVGDRIFVSGTVGDGALGLKTCRGELRGLSEQQRNHLVSRYLLPQPRTALADPVRLHASAAMDVSDGLAGDLAKLCRVSGVAAHIDVAQIPLSDSAKAAISANSALLEAALTGGDDYEIVCTVPLQNADAFRAAAKDTGVAVTEIGEIRAGAGALFTQDGHELKFERASFSHF